MEKMINQLYYNFYYILFSIILDGPAQLVRFLKRRIQYPEPPQQEVPKSEPHLEDGLARDSGLSRPLD